MKCMLTLLFLGLLIGTPQVSASEKMKALIVDGQNNHRVWPKTTQMMKQYLQQTGLFTVDVATTAAKGTDANFKPKFSDYSVVISNYNGAPWPKETQDNLVAYMKGGGGLVVVHAADNAFSKWPEYNRMIGLGGWGGRTEKNGPYVYYTDNGEKKQDTAKGRGGGHGARHEFLIRVRDTKHPITQGLPVAWMHGQDELYDRLRGPATNLHILATALSNKTKGGTGRHEPMLMVIEYGKGRVFHTTLGHDDTSQRCSGFIATFQRGAEWVATGKVTQSVPEDFPNADQVRLRAIEE